MPIPQARTPEQTRLLLQSWMSESFPGGAGAQVLSVATPLVGYSGETILFEAVLDPHGAAPRRRRLVARVRPAGYSFFPDVDMNLHYRVLDALEPTDVPAPRVFAYQDAGGSPFGEPFFVMEWVSGRVPPEHPPYTADGWLARCTPAQQAFAYRGAVEQVAKIHALDWAAMDLSFLPCLKTGSPGMANEIRQFDAYMRWVYDGAPLPVLEDAVDWLGANVPTPSRLCLNWGDAKFSNIVYHRFEPAGILDWELATIAPPEADLAFFLVYHDSITRARGYDDLPGFPDDDEAVELYQQLSGHTVPDLGYYKVWHLFRLAVMAQRLTDLLVERGVIEADAERAPHQIPFRLLHGALEAA